MHVPYDPDFDEPARAPVATVVRTQQEQSVFDAFSGAAAFVIGILTAFLALGAIGFFVLLAFIL